MSFGLWHTTLDCCDNKRRRPADDSCSDGATCMTDELLIQRASKAAAVDDDDHDDSNGLACNSTRHKLPEHCTSASASAMQAHWQESGCYVKSTRRLMQACASMSAIWLDAILDGMAARSSRSELAEYLKVALDGTDLRDFETLIEQLVSDRFGVRDTSDDDDDDSPVSNDVAITIDDEMDDGDKVEDSPATRLDEMSPSPLVDENSDALAPFVRPTAADALRTLLSLIRPALFTAPELASFDLFLRVSGIRQTLLANMILASPADRVFRAPQLAQWTLAPDTPASDVPQLEPSESSTVPTPLLDSLARARATADGEIEGLQALGVLTVHALSLGDTLTPNERVEMLLDKLATFELQTLIAKVTRISKGGNHRGFLARLDRRQLDQYAMSLTSQRTITGACMLEVEARAMVGNCYQLEPTFMRHFEKAITSVLLDDDDDGIVKISRSLKNLGHLSELFSPQENFSVRPSSEPLFGDSCELLDAYCLALSVEREFEALQGMGATTREGPFGTAHPSVVQAYPAALNCAQVAKSRLDLLKSGAEAFVATYQFMSRFSAGGVYARIVWRASSMLDSIRLDAVEQDWLRLLLFLPFYPERRGKWWARLAILAERHSKSYSVEVCTQALSDPNVAWGPKLALHKRLQSFERGNPPVFSSKRFTMPVLLEAPTLTIHGTRSDVVKGGKRLWNDPLNSSSRSSVGVEDLVIRQLLCDGHADHGIRAESKLWRMLFGLLLWPVLFADVEGAFSSPYQSGPHDLYSTRSFASRRAKGLRDQLTAIELGNAESILQATWVRHAEQQTRCVGVSWSAFRYAQLRDICACMPPVALAAILRSMAENYKESSSGMPDLVVWSRPESSASFIRFIEVKGPNDTLSEQQRVWIDKLLRLGLDVQVCHVVEDV
ncbi:hypothetical protein CAOG_01475 [Capsaspora owczarzaki ATCC 30864]|uniref:Fanconi-associated nuclease n=1 Tax=Capsaspora owczarzaki (strain ATCC 30864) TaxID=595528 RepID=A0A0D2U4S4_CAPO3|nr:hypothetical protein CAOG_01475 [Capsaspora owczarzaki ATCC 30864]KJE90126.1 hypothetical protein CAOG_001475 [Capsaspora owczarzaki ATCC 30864]|eukprot:XP_004364343.1 hypothetical protein CAOG_01475 [Capsaspora owczarzaki ATCC 30864]